MAVKNVYPGSKNYTHEVMLEALGQRWGIRTLRGIKGIQEFVSTAQPDEQRIEMKSFHNGRAMEEWLPEQYGFNDSRNAWTTTPQKAHASMRMKYAQGLRTEERNISDSVTFHTVGASILKYAVSFVATASSNREYIYLLIRKEAPAGTTGTPASFEVHLCADDSGVPLTSPMITQVVDADDIAEGSHWHKFDINTTALTSGTTYWIVAYAWTKGTGANEWGVGCNESVAGLEYSDEWTATTYSPLFRITDADVARQWYFFDYDGCTYAVDNKDDKTQNSALYINGNRGRCSGNSSIILLEDTSHGQTTWTTNMWAGWRVKIIRGTNAGYSRRIISNTSTVLTTEAFPAGHVVTDEYIIYSGDQWYPISSGLSHVTGTPVVSMGLVFFPQGDGTVIRQMAIDYTDSDDHKFGGCGVVYATKLTRGYYANMGPVLWSANNDSVTVARASVKSIVYGTALNFWPRLNAGDNSRIINNIIQHDGQLYIAKEDGLMAVISDTVTELDVGISASPSPQNGRALLSVAGTLYLNFGYDLFMIQGGGLYPTNLHSGSGIPSGRSGYISSVIRAYGWVFAAIDGLDDSTSSVFLFANDTQTWRELWRAPNSGERIRTVFWQAQSETNSRLLLDCNGDICYQIFPFNEVTPTQDSSLAYEPEFWLETPTFDMLTVDPKYFAEAIVQTKGLSSQEENKPGNLIYVEYQCDNDVGTDTWYYADTLEVSPVDIASLALSGKRKLRLRFRAFSSDATDPVIIEKISVSTFVRLDDSTSWVLDAKAGTKQRDRTGNIDENPSDLYEFLSVLSKTTTHIDIASILPELHGKKVVLKRKPQVMRKSINDQGWSGSMRIYLEELDESSTTT